MNILFCKWTSICETGVEAAFKRLGYHLDYIEDKPIDIDYNKEYLAFLQNKLQQKHYDFVFSINYMPLASRVCNVFKVLYVSWIVDCPSFSLYSHTIKNPYNKIFIFDYTMFSKFAPQNPDCIYYFPLGCDLEAWDAAAVFAEEHKKYNCDVSFIGSLYSEKCAYNDIKDIPDYIRGYVDGLINAQLNVYGYNFIRDSITDEFAKAFKECAAWYPLAEDYTEDIKSIIADTYIGYKCSEQERIRTFNKIAEHFRMDLWTVSDTMPLKGVNVRGGADSRSMMPKIIKCSKINLNITAKAIQTGLPLRIFDIMGAGGFLMSNYQSEIPEYFTPDEDLVLYESLTDLIEKIDYYLKHEEERKAIAKSGYEKVKANFTYEKRLQELVNILQL